MGLWNLRILFAAKVGNKRAECLIEMDFREILVSSSDNEVLLIGDAF